MAGIDPQLRHIDSCVIRVLGVWHRQQGRPCFDEQRQAIQWRLYTDHAATAQPSVTVIIIPVTGWQIDAAPQSVCVQHRCHQHLIAQQIAVIDSAQVWIVGLGAEKRI